MDALLPTFVAALASEIGDKTQLLAILLASHFRKPRAVLCGIALAAVANSLIAAFGGTLIHDQVNFRAIALMTALALILAGVGNFWRVKPPTLSHYGQIGAFGTSLLGFFILEFGDKTQFLTLTMAARTDSLWLAGFGAAAGIVVAAAAAVAIGQAFPARVPLRPIRAAIGGLFLISGVIAALDALRLI